MSDLQPICEVQWLGRAPYQATYDYQCQLAEQRRLGALDRLLLLEHPHTYTLGTSGHVENLLMSAEQRDTLGVEVVQTDRGGDITYHGPGQLVGYPILALPRGVAGLRTDVVGYVGKLEQTIIQTCATFGITAMPVSGLRGVWVETARGLEKIAAIGIKVDVHAITRHGFALNVNTDLAFFAGIVPCGITDKGVTSISRLLGTPVPMQQVTAALVQQFGQVFGYQMHTLADVQIG
jgi:lipoyl(octanoyl) transferase